VSCIPINTSISESVIISSSPPVLTGWLYTLYGSAINIIFAALSLILNYPGFKLTVTVYRSLSTRHPLPCVPCDPYIPIQFSNIIQHHFWPIKAWDGWPSPPVLKVGNTGKAPTSP
jgi:hypothetical protein